MLTASQFTFLKNTLKPHAENVALDAGCGLGQIAVALSRETGAHIIGIDREPELIREAHEHSDLNRVEFREVDLEDLPWEGPTFGAIYAVDSLYFTDHLTEVVASLAALLRPEGRLVIFWSQRREWDEPVSLLEPEHTLMAHALLQAGMEFTATEFTSEEVSFWDAAARALHELADSYVAEGYRDLVEQLKPEIAYMQRYTETGRLSRHAYVAHRV